MSGECTQISIQITQIGSRFNAAATARGVRALSHASAESAANDCARQLAHRIGQPLQKVTPFTSDQLVWVATIGEAHP